MTPSQQEFYKHLQESAPKFLDERTIKGEPRNPYPELKHLKSPAERYRNLVEDPNYWAKGKHGMIEAGLARNISA